MVDVSQRFKELRKKHKLTQKDVAEFLGITESGYGYYEQGRNEPSIEILKKLSKRYSVSMDYITGETDDPTPSDDKKFDALSEINILLKKYGINQSGFFDIEKWKKAGPEGIKQLESYFQFIVEQAEKMEKEEKNSNEDSFKK
ncbi:helix-turn-helix domain-containing protein [Ornithinibacillus bavariensis]|uniref:helix-turn-helix domain-containing protein n=1 Tax=Ornithinibacillus bavariensis TaxID=545502 RepID=UPI000EC1FC78|nr:transcriptional regulator [Ornithinibacillus sp.]